MTSFEWNGATFTVNALTVGQRMRINSVLVDIGKPILQHYGYEDFDNLPRVLSGMIADYVDLMIVTDIEGECPFEAWGDWFEYVVANTDKVQNFLKWKDAIYEHDELLSQWRDAYNAENRLIVNEALEKKGANSNATSETAPVSVP